MKTAIAILIALCLPLSAQTLLEKTPAQQTAERLDASQAELIRHIESQLGSFYSALTNPATAQAILDAFGNKAAAALDRYVKACAFVISIDPSAASRISLPNPTMFKANEDGTVTYTPPPAPPTPPAIPVTPPAPE